MILYLAIFLIILALFVLSQASRQRQATGLPGGQVIYTDTSQWDPVDKPLYDNLLDLTGKPDYLVKQGKMIIPVEVKSSAVNQAPYDSHIFQLAAYCRLVESEYNIRPSHGIIHYPNRTFRVDYTPELEEDLLDLLIEMRSKTTASKARRSHEAPQRCKRCGYLSTCDQSLVS